MHHSRHRPDILEARLTALECDTALYAAGNLAARAAALDVVLQVYQLLQLYHRETGWERSGRALYQQAKALETRLREADAAFVHRLRRDIRRGAHTPETLRCLFDRHTRYRPGRAGQIHRGYETFDVLIQGLIRAERAPATVPPSDLDMIPYAPTPARAVLDLVDQVPWTADDLFYDVGAGFGHVMILVHLLTGVAARGVEIEAAYCQHAQRCIEELGLSHVHVLHRDARDVDYTGGTVFFLYTPFTGQLLAAVLAALADVARSRPLTLCTYGACTLEVAKQPWLRPRHSEAAHMHALAVFNSL